MTTITIIGMGLCGNASFCQLIHHILTQESQRLSPITIQVFENKKEHFTTGAAYSTDLPDIWTLNNPAKDFKFIAGAEPLNSWISKNLSSLKQQFQNMNEEYCPRAVVGLYLRAQYTVYKNKAESEGINIVEYFDEVLTFDAISDNRWMINTISQQIETDFLYLCFGHLSAHHYPHLETRSGYYTATTPLSTLEHIPNDAPIYILGGQASFVDYALWLKVIKNHQGRLVSITRNPSIITTKGNSDTCDIRPITELKQRLNLQPKQSLSFSKARDSFWQAYKDSVPDSKEQVDYQTQPSTTLALNYQLTKYEKREEPEETKHCPNIDKLRAFVKVFFLNGAYEAFWAALSEEGKEAFNNLMYMQIMSYLTGITPVNTKLLLELLKSGEVLEKASLDHISYDETNQEFVIHFSSGEIETTKYLMDTSGYSYGINKSREPFIQHAVAKGYLSPKPLGGLEISAAGQPRNSQGKVQPTLFCIGPVASFADKYPTPYASFMVGNATEKAAQIIRDDLLRQTISSYRFDGLITLGSCYADCFYPG